jgi:hypothetical protein
MSPQLHAGLTSLYEFLDLTGLGMPANEIDNCVGDMIRRLNASRASSMN